jgi:hypothetical protein
MILTLAQIRTQARQRADMEISQFVTDSELTNYVNSSIAELYDILVSRFEDYYILDTPQTVANGASELTIPADFYKLKGLDYDVGGGQYETVRSFQFVERNETFDPGFGTLPRMRYRVLGSVIKLTPPEFAPGNYRIWYIPRFTPLVLDADTFDGINGWTEYVVVDCAIKMLNKEESDASAFREQKQKLLDRIEAMAADRDAGEPQTIVDMSTVNFNQRRLF